MATHNADSPANGIFESSSSSDDILLPHLEYHKSGKSTIILIHGAFASSADWDLVAPYLSRAYHLLIPDLPGHGHSRNITPFSVERSSRLVAHLIRKKAVNGSAHVVGHSMGAHVAIDLASKYPSVVETVFVSGFEVFPRSALSPYLPYIVWTMQRIENLVPRPLIRWLMDGAIINRVDTDVCTVALCRQIVSPMSPVRWPFAWPARALIVAAGKGGFIPSSDHPHDARRLMQIGNELNKDTIAFTHLAMRHPWNRQAPMLFAETARAWIEGEEILGAFDKL